MPSAGVAGLGVNFLWEKNETIGSIFYPGYLTKAVCLGGWIVSTVRGRVGSILLLKSGAAPVITTRRRRWCAIGAVARGGR